MKQQYMVAAVIAVVLSLLNSRYVFVGSGLTLLPWGMVSAACGATAHSRSEAWSTGAVYGFVQSFSFLLVDHSGAPGTYVAVVVLASVLSLLAAGCAAIAALGGWWLRFGRRPAAE